MRIAFLGTRQALRGAANSLVLPQRAALRIAQRAMRDDDLVRRELAGITGVDIGFGTEKGNLKSKRFTAFGCEPTGDVPPLGAKLRMTPQVLGKAQGMSGCNGCERSSRRGRRAIGAQRQQDRRQQGRCDRGERLAHQSSRTARTASWLKAARPLTIAVTAAALINTRLSSANSRAGTSRSMLQLKDCRLMT